MISSVPYYSQIVNYKGEDSGFPDAKEIALWQENCCGIACLRMVLDHFVQARPTYWDLLQLGLAKNAYIEAGWIHKKLLEMGCDFGLDGTAHRNITLEDLKKIVARGSLCIASVTVGFWGGEISKRTGKVFGRGGHLVVAYQDSEGRLACNDPGTRLDLNLAGLVLEDQKWERSMSGNLVEFFIGGRTARR